MKKVLIISLVAAAACGRPNAGSHLSGEYTNVITNELCVVYDTLQLTSKAKDVYDMERRSSVQFHNPADRVYDKKKRTTFSAQYERSTKLLRTSDPDIVFAHDPEKSSLRIDSFVYRKLK